MVLEAIEGSTEGATAVTTGVGVIVIGTGMGAIVVGTAVGAGTGDDGLVVGKLLGVSVAGTVEGTFVDISEGNGVGVIEGVSDMAGATGT